METKPLIYFRFYRRYTGRNYVFKGRKDEIKKTGMSDKNSQKFLNS